MPPTATLAAALAATVDWNQVPAVKLLGLALGALLLLWAIRSMFGRRR
jgi:glycerol uptake facilitator-like aquaporin